MKQMHIYNEKIAYKRITIAKLVMVREFLETELQALQLGNYHTGEQLCNHYKLPR